MLELANQDCFSPSDEPKLTEIDSQPEVGLLLPLISVLRTSSLILVKCC